MIEIELLGGINYCVVCDSLVKDVFIISCYIPGCLTMCKRCMSKIDYLAEETLRPKQEAHDED